MILCRTNAKPHSGDTPVAPGFSRGNPVGRLVSASGTTDICRADGTRSTCACNPRLKPGTKEMSPLRGFDILGFAS
jgi:hypothetical protein